MIEVIRRIFGPVMCESTMHPIGLISLVIEMEPEMITVTSKMYYNNVRYCECMYATRRTTTSENHLNVRYSEDKKERSKNNNLRPLTLHVQLCAYNRPYE